MAKTKTDIVENKTGALTVPDIFKDHVGMGTEEIKGSDVKFPMIKLLQKMSPQVDEDDDRYITGAKAGNFLNSDSKELLTQGFDFLPCAFVPTYIEWIKRESGGGIAGVYTYSEGLDRDKQGVPPENDLVLYHNFFGFLVNLETKEYSPAIVSLTSTGFTASRELNYKIKMQEGQGFPIFANFYHFESVSTENTKGKFYKWGVKSVGRINELWSEDWQSTLYKNAVELAKNAVAISKKVDYSAARDEVSSVDEETGSINNADRVM